MLPDADEGRATTAPSHVENLTVGANQVTGHEVIIKVVGCLARWVLSCRRRNNSSKRESKNDSNCKKLNLIHDFLHSSKLEGLVWKPAFEGCLQERGSPPRRILYWEASRGQRAFGLQGAHSSMTAASSKGSRPAEKETKKGELSPAFVSSIFPGFAGSFLTPQPEPVQRPPEQAEQPAERPPEPAFAPSLAASQPTRSSRRSRCR